jgi:hypothetical protein
MRGAWGAGWAGSNGELSESGYDSRPQVMINRGADRGAAINWHLVASVIILRGPARERRAA